MLMRRLFLQYSDIIGYTTPASSACLSLYCSDVAKMINAPILHVNDEYPKGVLVPC